MQDIARWCKMVQDSAIPCNTMHYHAIPCNTIKYYAIQCNTMQYHASLKTADGAYHSPVGSIRPFLSFVLLFFCLFGFLHFSSFHCIMCFSGAFWSCAGRTNRWVGWSSWVIGFLRAPSVLVNCNNQVKRALLGLLVLSTCGFLAAFFATSKGNMMCVYQHTRQWKRQEQMVPDIKQTFKELPRGVRGCPYIT